MPKQSQASQPPEPPPFERRIQIPMLQRVGIPLLMLLPILALAGVFGGSNTVTRAANDTLALQVESPTRTRYNLRAQLHVEVTNLSASEPLTLTVEFSRPYVDAFANMTFLPDVEAVTAELYRVEVPDVGAGETRVVTLDMQAEDYWRHRGWVRAAVEGPAEGTPLNIALETWVFP